MRLRPITLACALLALPALAAAADPGRLQLPDFSALSKKATQSVDISLGPSLLQLASGVISDDGNGDTNAAAVNDLIKGLKGIYVRSYTFDRPGEYSKADVKALQSQLLAPGWISVISTHDLKQGNDVNIYLRRDGDHTDGVAIIAAQPRQLTIVNIVGAIDLARLARLQGQFGVPRVGITVDGQARDGAPGTRAH
ncbi:MAG TPA: DUF4252 domain-containing protein [Steroidobacteraceae bacterium]|nr:DUF4252 domain-containing protein [Steroidobacteraceae bacterium]